MKSRLLLLFVFVFSCSLLSPLYAQEGQPVRTVIFVHGMPPHAYWSNQIDSIKFMDVNLDLSLQAEVTPNPNVIGQAKIKTTAGADAIGMKCFFAESYRLGKNMSDEDIMAILSSEHAYALELGKEYEFNGLQRKTDYTAIMAAQDQYGYLGKPVRTNFTMPDYPLQGDPQVEVKVYNIEQRGFTLDIIPNEACKGYYFLSGDIDKRTMGEATMRQYVKQWGGKFPSRAAYTGATKGFKYKDLFPSTDYVVYIVMQDANEQTSDVIEKKVRTLEKGTDKEATIATIEVTQIKPTTARVKVSPDENTSVYRYMLVPKDAYDNDDKTRKYVDDALIEPHSFMNPLLVAPDDLIWGDGDTPLLPNTEYYVVGRARNAKGVWGPLKKVTFRTAAGTSSATQSTSQSGIVYRTLEVNEPEVVSLDIRDRKF